MTRLLLITLLLLTMGMTLPVQAQSTCTALVAEALTQIGNNCANLGRNNACYGYNDVTATFTEVVPDTFFTRPADRAQLGMLKSLHTAPLDTANDLWGIATLNVQANLPNALPGQSVVFVLLGAGTVEDAVPPDEALVLPAEPLDLTTTAATVLRTQPDENAPAAGEVPVGTLLQADGMSADGDWLRVFFAADRQATAWVNTAALAANLQTTTLPVITPQSRTSMQAFRFQTGIGGITCDDAPSLLIVQGPEDYEVDIAANGLDIRIGSTIALGTLPGGGVQVLVIAGRAVLNPHSPNPIVLLPGFMATCPNVTLIDGNCEWETPVGFDDDLAAALSGLDTLFVASSNIFNYSPPIPIVSCPSGVGDVICQVTFDTPDVDLSTAAAYCAEHPADAMCAALFP